MFESKVKADKSLILLNKCKHIQLRLILSVIACKVYIVPLISNFKDSTESDNKSKKTPTNAPYWLFNANFLEI